MMKILYIIGAIYLAAGLGSVVIRRSWRDAVYGVREGQGIAGMCPSCAPTPWLPMVLAILVGVPLDVLLWPYNEWIRLRPPKGRR